MIIMVVNSIVLTSLHFMTGVSVVIWIGELGICLCSVVAAFFIVFVARATQVYASDPLDRKITKNPRHDEMPYRIGSVSLTAWLIPPHSTKCD